MGDIPRISVAMATFNGERFLWQQLCTLAGQSRPPDELIVSDDGSSDGTVDIVERFAASAPFAVHLHVQRNTVGYESNFQFALSHCEGALIFLCDQDDIWKPHKIERMAQEFSIDDRLHMALCDANIVLEDARPTGLTKIGQIRSLGLPLDRFSTGCCMAVRRELLQVALPFPQGVGGHDIWINESAWRLSVRTVIMEPLQDYRRHPENASQWLASGTKPLHRGDLIRENARLGPVAGVHSRLARLEAVMQRWSELGFERLSSELGVPMSRVRRASNELLEERAALSARLQLLQGPRVLRIPRATVMAARGQYRYFSGILSCARDVLDFSTRD